jgi:UDP-N-acetylmuramoyl-tripeptide--D-alanyl-D-alanine ligase
MSLNSIVKSHLTEIFGNQTRKIMAKYQPKIVAVAGSVGKTTTKIAIATVLGESFKVRYQKGNYNTPISIPFIFTDREMPSLYNPFSWGLAWLAGWRVLHGEFPYDLVIVELGTDAPGDIANLKSLINPDITVVTAVSEEHMEFFKTLDAVAAEELGVVEYSDTLIINSDDIDKKYIKEYLTPDKRAYTYGFTSTDYKITTKTNDKNGFLVDISMRNGENIETEVNILAEHNLKTLAAAAAVADLLGAKPEDIKKGLAKIKPMAGRMQLLTGIKDTTIIDDTYNSSPLACEAALKTLYQIKAPQRIAILGMMNELGEYSKQAHQRVGEYCDPAKLDLVVTIGKDANKYLADTARAKGCKVIRCNDPYNAARAVIMNLKSGAVVLAKGSQNGVFAEESVKMLLAKRSDAAKLVRQNSFWQAKKQAQFKNT